MSKMAFAGLALLLAGATGASATVHAARAPGPLPDTSAFDAASLTPQSASAELSARARTAGRGMTVRVWTEDERDLFNSGDRTRILLRTTADAYVAVMHIDTNGNLEMLFPSSPYEDGYLLGRRLYSLPNSGVSRAWTVRGSSGVGYLFAVASSEPLDFRSIRGLFGYRQAGWQDDRVVYGDPFYAMDRIARALVPDWGYVDHDEDSFSYQVGGHYSYPRYACYDGYGSWYLARNSVYESCDRVRTLLREQPYYYDTRAFRGDRRTYYERGRTYQPRYGYKESTRPPAQGYTGRRSDNPTVNRPPRRSDNANGSGGGVAEPTRQRPTLERRPRDGDPGTRQAPPAREAPRETPRAAAPPRDVPRAAAPPPRPAPDKGESSPRARPPA
ncbi:MAG TPA: DUF4384 domain-containing protein [Longimicrobiaceae bacterium]|jgi:hypothetical protein|nr:DUF4384 domain-containing protein [Longimicrobiaceae bacterium]